MPKLNQAHVKNILRLRRSIEVEVCKHKQFPDLGLEKMVYSQMQVKTDSI